MNVICIIYFYNVYIRWMEGYSFVICVLIIIFILFL